LMQTKVTPVAGRKFDYGRGLMLFRDLPGKVVGHMGSFPGFISSSRVDVDRGIAVAVLTNAHDGPAYELADGVVRILDRALAAAPRDAAAVGDLDRFTGRWMDVGGHFQIVRFGNELVGVFPGAVEPVHKASTLTRVPGRSDALKIHQADAVGNDGELITFRFAGNGQAPEIRYAGEHMVSVDARDAALMPLLNRPDLADFGLS